MTVVTVVIADCASARGCAISFSGSGCSSFSGSGPGSGPGCDDASA